jgi:hypothetical protein
MDDLSSFEHVENYANNIIVNWFKNVKCDMNCDLNVWLPAVVWEITQILIDELMCWIVSCFILKVCV